MVFLKAIVYATPTPRDSNLHCNCDKLQLQNILRNILPYCSIDDQEKVGRESDRHRYEWPLITILVSGCVAIAGSRGGDRGARAARGCTVGRPPGPATDRGAESDPKYQSVLPHRLSIGRILSPAPRPQKCSHIPPADSCPQYMHAHPTAVPLRRPFHRGREGPCNLQP